jgi:hypothetical protein
MDCQPTVDTAVIRTVCVRFITFVWQVTVFSADITSSTFTFAVDSTMLDVTLTLAVSSGSLNGISVSSSAGWLTVVPED